MSYIPELSSGILFNISHHNGDKLRYRSRLDFNGEKWNNNGSFWVLVKPIFLLFTPSLMPKKILIFSTDDFIPPAGGAEIAVGEITKRLSEFEFDLFCAKLDKGRPGFEKKGNVSIYRVGFGIPLLDKLLLALAGTRRALKFHKKNPYSLVWSVMASYGGVAAVKFKKRTGLPYLLTLQEGTPLPEIERKGMIIAPYFKAIFRCADGLQAISHFLFDWGGRMGFRGAVAEVVPNGVDVSNFSQTPDADEIAVTRKSFSFPEDAIILVTSSRLEIKNGIGDVIEALKLLPENVCFAVCGFGSLETELKKRVAKLGLERRVKFLGMVRHDRLPIVLKASDIFIRPSLSEGLGNAFLEAIAAGLPVIGTPVGGIPDFLREGETGFFCEPDNPESIVLAVKKIMELGPGEKEKILSNAQKLVREVYDWESVSGRMRNIFNKLIEKSA